jgi:diadenosine tetraphosphate (Ap4A) HIT family hydrolase
MEFTEEQLECLRGCSQYPQYYRGRKAFETGVCQFCHPNPKVNTVLYDQDGWIAWEVPVTFTSRKTTLSLQLLFFPKRHVRNQWELNEQERVGYFKVLDWAQATYPIPGGAIISRFGDMCYNVGTIMHLHATIYVPNRQGEVLIPLQKSQTTIDANNAQMAEFAKRYEAGEIP